MALQLSSQLPWELANNIWAQTLNPVLANPLNNVKILFNIPLVAGSNTVFHKLGRLQQGWFLTDLTADAVIYRSAPFNSTSLILTTSADATVSIGVF